MFERLSAPLVRPSGADSVMLRKRLVFTSRTTRASTLGAIHAAGIQLTAEAIQKLLRALFPHACSPFG